MNDIENNENNFTMNEYLEVEVNPKQLELCKDCYRALGWTIVNMKSDINKTTMRLQRERKIKKREQLEVLQENCETAFHTIEKLEESKEKHALVVSMGMGIVGTIFMALAVFAYQTGNFGIQIGLVILGFIGWGLPYTLYKYIKKNSTAKVEPMIAHNYDIIYDRCEKAASLLS